MVHGPTKPAAAKRSIEHVAFGGVGSGSTVANDSSLFVSAGFGNDFIREKANVADCVVVTEHCTQQLPDNFCCSCRASTLTRDNILQLHHQAVGTCGSGIMLPARKYVNRCVDARKEPANKLKFATIGHTVHEYFIVMVVRTLSRFEFFIAAIAIFLTTRLAVVTVFVVASHSVAITISYHGSRLPMWCL